MDGTPARRVPSPDGRREARVHTGGDLWVRDGREIFVASGVVAEIAWAPDGEAVVVPADTGFGADLLVARAPDWAPEPLIAWHGAEDRPLWSPDGERLAFVASTDGLPSVWVLDIATGATTRLTNEGVAANKRPGRAPDGFVPPPDGQRFEWTATGLLWTADQAVWTVEVPR